MRKIAIVFICLIVISAPAHALELTAPEPPKDIAELMPVDEESFSEGLWKIVKKSLSALRPDLVDAFGVCLGIVACVMLVSLVGKFPGSSSSIAEFTGVLAISLMLIKSAGAMIQLGAVTVNQLSEYGKMLLPVMTTAMAASGSVSGSAALYAGTAAFDAILSALVSKILIPVVYCFLVLSIASSATGENMIKKLCDGVSACMSWLLRTLIYVFTGYISITGVISGTTDAMALKATKLTVSAMVPLVGGILSDASEAVLVGADIVKSSVGIYGLLAVAAIWISPFLKLGVQYLLLKLTAGVCETFDSKPITDLIKAFASAMGILLGMTGAVSILLLVSTVCFMRGVA